MDDQFKALERLVIAAFAVITRMLAQMPIPVEVTPADDEDWEPLTAVMQLDRIRLVISDQPIGEETADLVSKVLLDWLTVQDQMALIAQAGLSGWRVDGVIYALSRIQGLAEAVAEDLGHRPYGGQG